MADDDLPAPIEPVKSVHLPAWITPMQAVAWIVTRDAAVVALAAEPPAKLTSMEWDD
jgi:hypothetical protein